MFNNHFYIKPVRQIEIPQTLSETNTAMTEFASGCPKEENGRLRGEAREHDTKNCQETRLYRCTLTTQIQTNYSITNAFKSSSGLRTGIYV